LTLDRLPSFMVKLRVKLSFNTKDLFKRMYDFYQI